MNIERKKIIWNRKNELWKKGIKKEIIKWRKKETNCRNEERKKERKAFTKKKKRKWMKSKWIKKERKKERKKLWKKNKKNQEKRNKEIIYLFIYSKIKYFISQIPCCDVIPLYHIFIQMPSNLLFSFCFLSRNHLLPKKRPEEWFLY